jgi:hypothetical protein
MLHADWHEQETYCLSGLLQLGPILWFFPVKASNLVLTNLPKQQETKLHHALYFLYTSFEFHPFWIFGGTSPVSQQDHHSS